MGRGGQVGQLEPVEPAAGVGAWETDDRQASFLRAGARGAMPGLLALDGRLAPMSLGRSATDLLETPKEGGWSGGRDGEGEKREPWESHLLLAVVKARIISRLAPCRVSQSGHHAPRAKWVRGAGHGSSTRLYSSAYRERGGERRREEQRAVESSEEEWRGVRRSLSLRSFQTLTRQRYPQHGTIRTRDSGALRQFDCNLAICFSARPPHLASPASPGRSESPSITEPQVSMNGGVQQLACVEKIPLIA